MVNMLADFFTDRRTDGQSSIQIFEVVEVFSQTKTLAALLLCGSDKKDFDLCLINF